MGTGATDVGVVVGTGSGFVLRVSKKSIISAGGSIILKYIQGSVSDKLS